MNWKFRAVMLDDSPRLLEAGYRLRYRVYCLERKFLATTAYPNGLEVDEFDRDSVHVGVLDADDILAGTARIVRRGPAGLPLFRHCTLFPHDTALTDVGNTVVEVSRVSISRSYSRRQDDPPFAGAPVPETHPYASVAAGKRRQRSADPFLTLLKAVIHGAKRMGATHLVFAIEVSLHRWLVQYGFPYRLAGPEAEYYGRVAPYIMSFADFDRVVLGRQFAVLNDFPVGTDPERWPKLDEPDTLFADCAAAQD